MRFDLAEPAVLVANGVELRATKLILIALDAAVVLSRSDSRPWRKRVA
jgi:hypothetical protein